MGAREEPFAFDASFTDLEEGLDAIHRSVDRLRRAMGRGPEDRDLMFFETALGEIGSNVFTHGRPPGTQRPIDYSLHFDGTQVVARLSDSGPPVHEHLAREMPGHESEEGRGLALARSLLDELGYERDGELNRWRLVKRL